MKIKSWFDRVRQNGANVLGGNAEKAVDGTSHISAIPIRPPENWQETFPLHPESYPMNKKSLMTRV